MQERLVLVNHLSTGSIARRLLFHMVTTKPPKFVFKNELLTNIRNWPFREASHFVRRIPVGSYFFLKMVPRIHGASQKYQKFKNMHNYA